MTAIKVEDFFIGNNHSPFIIAEMSGNHNHSLERALAIVEAAANAGVQAIKLQTYTADTMTLDINDRDFVIKDPNSLWYGNSLYQLYRQAYTPWEWHKPIFDKCRELGIIGFSTPFDETAVDFLESLGAPCYKIASFENVDLPLIKKVAATGKPLFISTGMASLAELDQAVGAARGAGCQDLVLLKCTSSYPAAPVNSNLATIPHMRDLFTCQAGVSDHTMGVGVSIAAVALGATVIEKHFTLSRADGGVDAAFSMEPGEMGLLVTEASKAWQASGKVFYGPTEEEMSSLKHRRSLYVVQDMNEGEIITVDNIRVIRPGAGLPPKYFDLVLGKKVNRQVKKGTPLTWDLIG